MFIRTRGCCAAVLSARKTMSSRTAARAARIITYLPLIGEGRQRRLSLPRCEERCARGELNSPMAKVTQRDENRLTLADARHEELGLEQLISEDFQRDRLYGTVRVVNPFL